jgi:hypothetical protein
MDERHEELLRAFATDSTFMNMGYTYSDIVTGVSDEIVDRVTDITNDILIAQGWGVTVSRSFVRIQLMQFRLLRMEFQRN